MDFGNKTEKPYQCECTHELNGGFKNKRNII